MNAAFGEALLANLAFPRVRDALAERAATRFGVEAAEALAPFARREDAALRLDRVDAIRASGEVPLGGIEDVRGLLDAARNDRLLEGREILSIAYTLDGCERLRRAVAERDEPSLLALAERMGSFEGWLRVVREQLDGDGEVRDDATPKLREIRRRLRPLRGRIRERMQVLLEQYSEAVQDPIVTLRRERYVLSIRAEAQSKVPGIAIDSSDSGRTVFIEPQAVVAMNNELALLEFEERDEVRRILLELASRIAAHPELSVTFEVVAAFDLASSTARLAEDWGLMRAVWREAEEEDEAGSVHLPAARHPLVEACVANDLSLDAQHRLLIVTGPNAGGKTVLLKTLGLAVLMAQSGVPVAAGRAGDAPGLPWFTSVLADIGDEQSIEASLSTYAGHLVNLNRIVREADEATLVLIDELGSGTDPDEGAALSQAILEQVLATGARGLVTTHLAPLKVFASEAAGVRNASMRFDVDALAPTFELTVGQPGRSYALSIAHRLGLGEGVLDRASDLLGPEGERLERLLETLERQREQLSVRLREVEAARDEARREAASLETELARLREREETLVAEAAARADAALQETLQRATRLTKTARQEEGEGRSQALEEIRKLRSEAQRKARPKRPAVASEAEDGWRPGVRVRVPSYDAEGRVVEVRGDALLVQLGLLKLEVAVEDVERLAEERSQGGGGASTVAPVGGFDAEINVRGERAEVAVEKVRDFVLEAQALRVPMIRVLHGKGTGALRDAIREYLKREKRVERFEDAVPYEGGHGVTVAHVKVP